MSEVKKFGPYKGSAQNGGRPIYVYKKKVGGKWVTTSKNKARADYESKNGKLPRDTDVDHKDNNKKVNNKNKKLDVWDFLVFNFINNILKSVNQKLLKELHLLLYQLKDSLFKKLDLILMFMDRFGF